MRSSPWRRLGSAALAGLVAAVGSVVALTATAAPAPAAPPGGRDVTAVLFNWNFDSVARECTERLGPAGYGYVQVSPPQEQIQGSQWWTAYQPVSYRIASRLGDRAQFANMVDTCAAAGVGVVVDTVINHMTSGSGTGTGGSAYTKYHYPAASWGDADFHTCRTNIGNYQDRFNVQNCELVGLADLDTGSDHVRQRLADYLNDLLSLGVAGFRIDAAKHIAAADLAAIRSRLTDPDAYWKQEVIYGAGEAVSPEEYRATGDVQEFRYGRDLKRVFESENLAYLANFGEGWGYLPSEGTAVFVDNHDTERNGSTLTYKSGAAYTLANVFMLAWPYGSPDVHSGYEFSDNDAGPPNNGRVAACWQDGWKCQHAWPEIESMVAFRNATGGQPVGDWWDDGADAIAFGRGDRGFVAINHESSALTRTFQTSLPAGGYCDVQSGTAVTVDGSGRFTATLAPDTALALHVGARDCSGTGTPEAAGASFAVTAETQWGESVFVVGDRPELGGWDPGAAVPLGSGTYPVWRAEVALPAGTRFAYTYVRRWEGQSGVTWESGANRVAVVPSSGRVRLADTWRG
ncbi:carbohydrate-binding module family 20 domain-containing protein [Streptomyces hoynatensis]|uniref:Alpha-amylase n=1 Tax=Streptomyces hoynatensis TaxID=1141874 RepID=A0A3A9Z0B1_9ACTN|nr:carbohydrate-binding module family 20 domain-containing protein [Streptomyces hoynatensis]RKN41600.1 glycosidase [Streptomyces hoynatensis]